MISLDWTLWAAGVVFLLTAWALNKLLFQPLFATVSERRARTVDLEGTAVDTVRSHDALFEEYSDKVRQEKQQGYQLAESVRQQALDERQKRLTQARETAGEKLQEAREKVEADILAAEKGLQSEVEVLAGQIAQRAISG